ncbi:protein ovarian tumor locus isoform X2 [Nilaparvata lugens]|uniref:protein ovarian tumor locus isoform X2 n=1 Tax=Nilaparvata lugens TaxID=108931 RepID=UPI00193DF4A0|nr:protein ovarian tumor locus isoform X2 [Nilaparvata lugens]
MTNRTKMWLKPTDQMDLWLETQNYYRKHTARDSTCLFRAVAEQLGLTQHCHLKLRRQVVDYVLLFEDLFKDKLSCTLKEYENRMRISTEWAGEFELDVISRIYKCDFLLFREVGKPADDITGRGYDEKIMLCVSQERHYDSVYTKEHISDTAYCQSLVYEQLYKRGFGLVEVDFAVKKMLHDKAPRYQRDTCMSFGGMALRLEMRDTCLNVKELLLLGVTPFPYKVAKSLDPEIYRNVEYDTWNDYRKGLRYGNRVWTANELCIGVKCRVKLDQDKNYHGFIQEMEPDKGPVLIFVEELGEKITVPYECLELLPPPSPQPQPSCLQTVACKQLRHLQAVKQALLAQQQTAPDSSTAPAPAAAAAAAKKPTKNGARQKAKETNEADAKKPNANSVSYDDQHSMQSSNYLPSAAGSDSYEQELELDFQQEIHGGYQQAHLYPTQSAEISSSMNPECEQAVNMASCPPVAHYAVNTNPNNVYHIPPPSTPAYCAVNYVPARSLHPDGSDLPMADLPTLRYYYNVGLDYSRMNYMMQQPAARAATTHCYVPPPTPYIADPSMSAVSYVNYEPAQAQPAPAVYPAAVTNQQPSMSTDDRHRSPSVVTQPQPQPCATPTVPPATVSPAAATFTPSTLSPSHFVPVQSSYSPLPPPTAPVYFHPVEPYYDYSMYDASAIYPTTFYQPHTSYVTAEGVYYQPYVQPATLEY